MSLEIYQALQNTLSYLTFQNTGTYTNHIFDFDIDENVDIQITSLIDSINFNLDILASRNDEIFKEYPDFDAIIQGLKEMSTKITRRN